MIMKQFLRKTMKNVAAYVEEERGKVQDEQPVQYIHVYLTDMEWLAK